MDGDPSTSNPDQTRLTSCRYGYVRGFEQPDNLLPNTFVVVRIDGRGFTKYDSPRIVSFQLRMLASSSSFRFGAIRGLAAYTVEDEVF